MGCGCSDLSDVLTALPIVLRLDDGRTLGVRVPGVPVVVPLKPMFECPGPYNRRVPQEKSEWRYQQDCDGPQGQENNFYYTRHKCIWYYSGWTYVACSEWYPQGCTSLSPQNPLCNDAGEDLCADTRGYCQTQ